LAIFTGDNNSNTLTGGSGNDTLRGLGGDDTLSGGLGNDYLDGGTGSDSLDGGDGDDTYVVDNAGDIVTDSSGIDKVNASVDYTLGASLEKLTLTGTTAINGTGNALNNTIIGNSIGNTLIGGDGNDYLDGGGGIDTLDGGNGNDTYIVGNFSDVIIDSSGIDKVNAAVTYILQAGNGIENLTLTGTSNINGTGNELDNIIGGNSGDNRISGGDGNDTISGGAGNDTLDGDNGDDRLSGGAGFDTLTGGDGNDSLNGGADDDAMTGGLGDDTYTVDSSSDTITEAINSGTDRVISSATITLSANVENLTLTGLIAIDGTGNILDNTIIGNAAANTLIGGAGNDIINGGTGDDVLSGGVDNDLLLGGNGNDSLDGGDGDDILSGGTTTVGQIDTLTGGLGADTFVLGLATQTLNFYDDGVVGTDGTADYALITDFVSGTDTIQLKGASTGYTLSTTSGGLPSGTGIYKNGSPNELLGIVENVTLTDFTDFTFVNPTPPPA
jgi:Ca2+-binding RTX toxin-like protein